MAPHCGVTRAQELKVPLLGTIRRSRSQRTGSSVQVLAFVLSLPMEQRPWFVSASFLFTFWVRWRPLGSASCSVSQWLRHPSFPRGRPLQGEHCWEQSTPVDAQPWSPNLLRRGTVPGNPDWYLEGAQGYLCTMWVFRRERGTPSSGHFTAPETCTVNKQGSVFR